MIMNESGAVCRQSAEGFFELKGMNHRLFMLIKPMNPGEGIYESVDNRTPVAAVTGPPGLHKKKPRLSVGAAMKRMEKLLLDSKKHLKFLPLYLVLV